MPNRILKESICTSEDIDGLSWFCEVFWYRLIVNCDDFGRIDARPAILKSKLFPLKDSVTKKNVEDAVTALSSAGLIFLYEVQGKPYLQLKTWNEHQQVRAQKSKYPDPKEGSVVFDSNGNQMISDDIKCSRNPIQSESNPIREAEDETPARGGAAASADDMAQIVELYQQNINPEMSPLTAQKIADWLNDVDASLVRYAIEQAVDHEKRTWAYINTILRSHFNAGRKTAEAAKRVQRGGKKSGNTPEKKSKYDFEAFEQRAREALHG